MILIICVFYLYLLTARLQLALHEGMCVCGVVQLMAEFMSQQDVTCRDNGLIQMCRQTLSVLVFCCCASKHTHVRVHESEEETVY